MNNGEPMCHEGISRLIPEWKGLLEAADRGAEDTFIPGPFNAARVTPLFGDGSDRLFRRIRYGTHHFVFLSSPRRKPGGVDENDSYFLIGHHLFNRGIPVPRIVWADPSKGWFLLEDVGDVHLQRLVLRGRANRVMLYRKVLSVLLHLHRLAPDGFSPSFCFDAPVYNADFVLERELHYFRDAFLIGWLEREDCSSSLERDFENIAESAAPFQQRWVIHRDFQSRNLMVWRGGLRVIDFQGMRYGPPAYDLASLLIDPYVGLDSDEEEALVRIYWNGASRFLGCARAAFMKSYSVLKLCRNLQALAAYAYLTRVKGKHHFLDYIQPAWARLGRTLSGPLGTLYPALKACVRSVGSASLVKRVEQCARLKF
ncbi:MAG: aminoglycoside phosphotransferase family protein [Syntrophobacteraceae bacterium]